MQICLVEPYFGGSHRVWAEGYRDHSDHEVTLLTHPARWWRWRMRGAAVTLAEKAARLAEGGYQPDLVLVSDMVDLPALRTLLRPIWGDLPTALYFHESQLTYPDSPQIEPDLGYAMTNWLSALTADRVLFNSGYHRRVFFDEVRRFLRGLPDLTHEHLVDQVEERSSVLPVGVDLGWIGDEETPPRPLVLWNHRWEHDKAPEVFFEAMEQVERDFELAVCGQNFRQEPTEFETARATFADRIVAFGEQPLEQYRRILARSTVVVSTSLQEFFGISVVEAVAAGARPVLPNRLSYPWLIPDRFHEQVLYQDGGLTAAVERAIDEGALPGLAAEMHRFSWREVAPKYDAFFSDMRVQGPFPR